MAFKSPKELKTTLAELFGVHVNDVGVGTVGPPWDTGAVQLDSASIEFSFETLSKLSELLGHKGINIRYTEEEEDWSEVTAGAASSMCLIFDPDFVACDHVWAERMSSSLLIRRVCSKCGEDGGRI